MINELQKKLYTDLRDSVSLSQIELAEACGVPRSTLQRIETAKRLPTPEEEEAILMATDTSRLEMAELICKALSELVGRRVTIVDDEVDYQAATPEGELTELLRTAYTLMPRHRWWAWRERVGRYKTLGQLHDAEGYAHVRDLTAEVEALLREEEEAAEAAAEEAEALAAEKGEGGDMLPFRKPKK